MTPGCPPPSSITNNKFSIPNFQSPPPLIILILILILISLSPRENPEIKITIRIKIKKRIGSEFYSQSLSPPTYGRLRSPTVAYGHLETISPLPGEPDLRIETALHPVDPNLLALYVLTA